MFKGFKRDEPARVFVNGELPACLHSWMSRDAKTIGVAGLRSTYIETVANRRIFMLKRLTRSGELVRW